MNKIKQQQKINKTIKTLRKNKLNHDTRNNTFKPKFPTRMNTHNSDICDIMEQ